MHRIYYTRDHKYKKCYVCLNLLSRSGKFVVLVSYHKEDMVDGGFV